MNMSRSTPSQYMKPRTAFVLSTPSGRVCEEELVDVPRTPAQHERAEQNSGEDFAEQLRLLELCGGAAQDMHGGQQGAKRDDQRADFCFIHR